MDSNGNFLESLAEYKNIRYKIKRLAWQITPNDIRGYLLDFFEDQENALEWLIKSSPFLEGKCPIEAIIEDEHEEVRKLIIGLIHGVIQ